MPFKISIDKEKCIGCSSCTAICPKSFELKKDKAIPKQQIIEKITCEPDAEAVCPVQAIKIEEI